MTNTNTHTILSSSQDQTMDQKQHARTTVLSSDDR
jgi:hypothetical protein